MIGQTVSHYKIVSKIGQGGMGEVYLAEDTRLDRRVALKFLAPELARDHESLIRFRNEAKAAAELSHPNIATIHDIGEVDGKPFLVLEYLEGQTLRERVAQGPLPIEDVLRIGKALAAGLAEAHSHGIIHRDIKSANVMLTEKGDTKILDFGLAHRADATQITREGTTLGTIGYMSPEQARGEEADERSDIWSLGVVLYECLTGRLPFTGEGAAVIEQIKTAGATPPTALRTGIPMEFEQAIIRCLEKDPQLRYQHADDFLAKLTGIVAHLASDSGRASLDGTQTSRRRSQVQIATVVVLIAVAVSIVWWQWRPETVETPISPADQSVAVVDFRNLLDPDDHVPSELMTSLVNVGLIENGPCRVISSEYLHDLRRRLFGSERGAIQQEEALAVARKANATLLVVGEVTERGGGAYITWRLVDADSGRSLGGQRIQGEDIFSLADSALVGMMPLLARSCGVEPPTVSKSVTEITTSSPEAYRSFTNGQMALDEMRTDDALRHFERAVAADSTFALAHFRLAAMLQVTGDSRAPQAFDKAWELRSRMGMKDRMLLEAYRAALRSEVTERTAIYEEMLSRWPDDRDALNHASDSKNNDGHSEEARVLMGRAMDLYPDDRLVANKQVYTLLRLQRADEALALAQALANKFPENPNAWDTLGEVYLLTAEIDSAEAAFRKAIAIHPTFWYGHMNIAQCAYYRGDAKTAIDSLQRLQMRPTVPANFVWTSTSYLRGYHYSLGRYEDALRLNADLIRQAPDSLSHVNTLLGSAGLNVFLGRCREALLSLDRVASTADSLGVTAWKRSQQPYISYVRGLAAVGLDSLEAAHIALKELENDAKPKGPYYQGRLWGLEIRGWICLFEGRPEEALSLAQEWMAVRSVGPSIQCQRLLVATYQELGRPADAADVLRSEIRAFGGWALNHYKLAQLLEELEEFEEAESEYTRFLEMWVDADEGLPELEDARRRLKSLRARS